MSENELKEIRELISQLRTQLATGSERFQSITHRCTIHNDALFDPETGAIQKIAVIRERLATVSRSIDDINRRLVKMEYAYWRGVGALAVIQTVAVIIIKVL